MQSPAPIDQYFGSPMASPAEHGGNVDDIIYRYSAEYDRGTPTVGIYAQDGLWDDDEQSETHTARPTSGAPSSAGGSDRRRFSVKTGSSGTKGRSRSGTVSTVANPREDESNRAWTPVPGWARKASFQADGPALGSASPDLMSSPEVPSKSPVVKQKRSMNRLRGKGRRGELTVDVEMNSTPPLPVTPASLESYAFSPPPTYPSRFNSPASTSTTPNNANANAGSNPASANTNTLKTKSSMSWKRGVQKIFRSKSSVALREATSTNANANALPPVPQLPTNLPQARHHLLGKPFSSSTPPLGESRRTNILSPPPSGRTFARAQYDPFASSLDLAADPFPRAVSGADLPPPSRPKLPRNSPSLKDLKSLLHMPSKSKLGKAKSTANLKAASAPPDVVEFPVLNPGLGFGRIPTRTPASQVESPPLEPPNPPYFPLPQRTSSSGLTISTALPSPLPSTPLTPPPTAPLPPAPVSAMTQSPSADPISVPSPISAPISSPVIDNSTTAKLLPRSRSTSMSLASPPTSSSFFDLYEQLGIWPTPEKPDERMETVEPVSPSPARNLPGLEAIPPSSSTTFSISSWEAALNAFPLLEKPLPQPQQGEMEVVEADVSMSSNAARGSVSTTSSGRGLAGSTRSGGTARVSRSNANPSRASGRWGGGGGGGGGSAGSSRGSSRERRPRSTQTGEWLESWSDSNDSSSSADEEENEEDDVPLSRLHPDAAAAQAQRRAKPRRGRKDFGRNPGGDSGWDGEGGVPAEVLRRKLERLSLRPLPSPMESGPSNYPWAAARPRQRATSPTRSVTDPSSSSAQATTQARRAQTFASRQAPLPSPVASVPPPSVAAVPTGPPLTRLPSRAPPVHAPASTPAPINLPLSRTSTTARTRPRAQSNASSARHGTATDERMIRAQAQNQPMPQRSATHVKAFVGDLEGNKVTLEVFPETTARDVISAGLRSGDLAESQRGSSWVVVELFAELGCERQIREYELLQTVVRGWEPSAYNCLVFKLSTRAISTFQRAIPNSAPYLGSWVQYETKKGKWSKRWLETRGGQVFLAKNEKNKDEIHLNTMFFDVFHMTRPYNAPKPFVFVIKRMEPEAAFENREDYVHVFSADEGIAWKLMTGIYDAKSFALQPHLSRTTQKRPTGDGPLISLDRGGSSSASAFTGKGLLKV